MRPTSRNSQVVLLVAACFFLFAAAVKADPIVLFSTGVGADGIPMAGGSIDPHYILVSSPLGAANIYVSSVTPPPWVGAMSGAQWISPQVNSNVSVPAGLSTYRTTFDLTGFDVQTVLLGATVAADNAVRIVMNGIDTGIFFPDFTKTQFFDLSKKGLLAGVNTIDFVVINAADSPSGLLVRLQGFGTQGGTLPGSDTPEPASLALVGSGITALVVRARRKRHTA